MRRSIKPWYCLLCIFFVLMLADGISTAGLFSFMDNEPPAILLKESQKTLTVFMEKFYLEGELTDDTGLESLTINQTPLSIQKTRHAFFSEILILKTGDNYVTIVARDTAGNESKENLTITRKESSAIHLASRLSLVVLPFENTNRISSSGIAFEDSLMNALTNQNRFRMIERSVLDEIIREQNLGHTRLFDSNTASQLGKLATAQSAITGTILQLETGIEITARFIDTETSEILSTQTVFQDRYETMGISDLAQGLALKFYRDFPLTDGVIIERNGSKIQVNLGQNQVRPGRRILVFRQIPVVHPLTGKVIGLDNQVIASAIITQIHAGSALAELINVGDIDIKPMDRVITE